MIRVRTVGHLSLAEWHTSLAVRAGMAIARSSIARSSVATGRADVTAGTALYAV